jgi:hypothetical protein
LTIGVAAASVAAPVGVGKKTREHLDGTTTVT